MSSSVDSVNSLGNYLSLFQMNAQSVQKRHDDLFSKLDSNSDGGIDKVEFSTFAQQLSKNSGSSLDVDDVFSQDDTNGDGVLSSDELKSFMKENAPPPPMGMGNGPSQMNAQSLEEFQDDLFAKLDTDNSSSIDKTEFSALAKRISKDTGNSLDADNVFSQYDINGDGVFSSDELKSFMKENAPPPPQMQKAMSAYGTGQATDQTTTLQDLLNQLSSSKEPESTYTDSFKAMISQQIESLLNGVSSFLVNVTT